MIPLGDPCASAELLTTTWERLDDRFAKINGDDKVSRIASGCRWAEGGTYVPAGRYFVWSDIPNDRMLRWDEMTGVVGVFRSPANYANGNTLDLEGRLVTCEQGTRRLTRTEHDGSVRMLVNQWQGLCLNSPNDVIVKSDGSIWFTDPTYGIDADYEGHTATPEIDARHVYRIAADARDAYRCYVTSCNLTG